MKNLHIYEVRIYGKANSIFTSIREKCLMMKCVSAYSHKEATEKVWAEFIDPIIKRTDIRIESERMD